MIYFCRLTLVELCEVESSKIRFNDGPIYWIIVRLHETKNSSPYKCSTTAVSSRFYPTTTWRQTSVTLQRDGEVVKDGLHPVHCCDVFVEKPHICWVYLSSSSLRKIVTLGRERQQQGRPHVARVVSIVLSVSSWPWAVGEGLCALLNIWRFLLPLLANGNVIVLHASKLTICSNRIVGNNHFCNAAVSWLNFFHFSIIILTCFIYLFFKGNLCWQKTSKYIVKILHSSDPANFCLEKKKEPICKQVKNF